LTVLRDAILRVAAAGHQRHHLVTDLVTRRAAADRDHLAGDFETGQVAGAGRWWIDARALRHVGPVDACGSNLDQYLARTWHRYRAGFRQQHFGPSGLADADNGHLRRDLFHDLSLQNAGKLAGCLSRFKRSGETVRAKKARQNKNPEPGSDLIRTDQALTSATAAGNRLNRRRRVTHGDRGRRPAEEENQ